MTGSSHGHVASFAMLSLRRTIAVAAGATCLMSGCTQNCNLVGSVSGVRVQVPPDAVVTEFCLDDTCVGNRLEVLLDSDEPATHNYLVRVTLPDGDERVLEGTVSTEEYFANGRGCEPRTANATLVVGADGSVAVAHP
jgi:hypothetical protein